MSGRVRSFSSGLVVAALTGLVILTPELARACAVCTAGRDEENQLAFLLSTLGMSLMPLIAIGTLVFVLWRRIKKLEAETAVAADALDALPSRV